MMIKYTKLVNNEVVYTKKDNEDIISSCFDFCPQWIRTKVNNWLESGSKQLTVQFNEFKVRLEK